MSFRKILSIIICTILLVQLFPETTMAAINAPDRTVIYTTDTQMPATGYSADDGYYADIEWQPVTKPVEWDNTYYNVYIQEISRTGVPGAFTKKLDSVTSAKARLRNLKSGTMYNIYVTAYFSKTVVGGVTFSNESEQSNIVTVMTDIQITAYPYGAKQIKISWDDVWLAGSRISYSLYIADDSAFAGSEPIPISASQVGVDGRIVADQAAGKLTYVHTVDQSGRVYYIKIKPELSTLPIFYNPESKPVATASYILVKTTKMYETTSGTVWRLDWSQVAVAFKDIKITYQLYKVDKNNNNLPQYMLSVDNNSTYLTVPAADADNYYIIRALVTDRYGNDIYKDWNVKIQSDKVYLKDFEVPATPVSPELVNKLMTPSKVVESYTDSLKPDSATLLWNLPRKGNGDIDYDVSYDMWMITDPQRLNDPDASSLVAQDIKIGDIMVDSDQGYIGAKYTVNNLVPNSTYYFRIVAKKTYVEYVDGNIENVTLTSVPATKLVITPPVNNGDTPIAPAAPPLQVKTVDGKKIITDTEATISIKNKWYERFVSPRWKYVPPTPKLQPDSTVKFTFDTDNVPLGTVEGDVYSSEWRTVRYDGGITIDVGAVEYVPGMNYNDLNDINKYPTNKLTGVQVFPNDSTENTGLSPDGQKHNVDIKLTDLKPNTTYVVWVRAVRGATGAVSNASDPIFITTNPDGSYIPEKPPVPNFNYGYAGDTYVELGWNFNTDYVYNIKYSTGEVLDNAEGSITVTGQEMVAKKFLTIDNLKQSTNYYFWIQAQYVYNNQPITSDFGDAYHLKTTEFTPPHSPYGFGIKGGTGSITKDSITYEWMASGDLQYILEIADNINYTNSTTYEAGSVSEYQVTGLKPNTRYYARLYAYDKNTDLKSLPTQSIIAKTLKSKDDYDTDEDTDNVISGDFIVKDPYAANGIWNVTIVGVNADRFIEEVKNSQQLEYIIDLKNPPAKITLTNVKVSAKVFTELSRMGRTLTFATPDYSASFAPGVLDGDTFNNVYTDINVSLYSGVTDSAQKPDKIYTRSAIGRLAVTSQKGTGTTAVASFGQPARISYNMSDVSWYNDTDSFGYYLTDKGWTKTAADLKQDTQRNKNTIAFMLKSPGDFLVGQYQMSPYTDTFGSWAGESIKTLTRSKDLKSVNGTLFKPDNKATLGDALKMIFDVTGFDYSSNYMLEAYKAGLINKSDAIAPNSSVTTEKALYILMSLYEKKSGEKLVPSGSAWNMFPDMNSVSSIYLDKVSYAVENGIYSDKDRSRLNPIQSITRADLADILVKYLEFTGEVQ